MERDKKRRLVVLVVDDDRSVRNATIRLIRMILGKDNVEMLSASDGVGALEVIRARGSAVDLVLTDVQMPNMSGYELKEELLRQRFGGVILTTSGTDECDLEKPAELNEVKSLLFRVLGLEDSRTSSH